MTKNKKLIIIIASVLSAVALVIGGIYGFLLLNDFHVSVVPNGEQTVTLEYGQSYEEQGASAHLFGKWIYKNGKPLEVITEGEVDTSKLGAYTVKYSAKDGHRKGEAIRTVSVVDTVLPVLTLEGKTEMSVTLGKTFEDPGAVATDNYDGDITSKITVTGEVDTKTKGEYSLVYEVSDSSGNKQSITRTVTVKEAIKMPTTVNPGAKVVYLTFDDGPGPYTQKLLNVLDKYGVKATFFVTNNNPGYNHLFKKMTDAGHAIAIHTASHNYRKIYASEEAFFNDVYKMQDIIEQQTGKKTYLLRFPGGSSNTTSSFNKGIMTRLSEAVTEKGFRYFDWNVTSGDAGETTSTSQVASNVINGMASHSVSVVLQHDIKNFSVNAVEQIIQWGLENGYTFKACDMTSPTAHHGINN
ncbi:MAG: polysaccharide deacetylase family protein [Clostridia bacterium]|nr:polysaccharide deacetylase family protein [Clostridia bacterium]